MFAVQATEFANTKGEMVPVGMGHVVHLMVAKVHAARRNFMQFGFPNMGTVFIHQGDKCLLLAAKGFAKSGGKFESTGTAAHDHNSVHFFVVIDVHTASFIGLSAMSNCKVIQPTSIFSFKQPNGARCEIQA